MRQVGPAWTLEGRRKQEKIPDIPGPGAYSSKQVSVSPSYTISRSNRNNSRSPGVPGPGQYEAKSNLSSKSAIFGSSARMGKYQISPAPGPGVYECKSVISEGPKFSLKGRIRLIQKPQIPGPGDYDPKTPSFDKTFTHSFTKEPRLVPNIKEKEYSPGPGAYDIPKELNRTGIKFGNETRVKSAISFVPGPGAYSLPSIQDNKGFSISGKVIVKEAERSPGPGNYTIRSNLEDRSYSIGRSARFKYRDNMIPGPGAYNENIPKSNSNLIFGRSKRESYIKTDPLPGPGSYKTQTRFIEGPSYTIRPKTETKPLDFSPGPAEYNLHNIEKVKAPVFGSEKKCEIKYDQNPGPGQYSTPEKKYGKWRFGNEAKLKYLTSDVPGPGSYDYPLYK